MYVSPAWRVFATVTDLKRVDAFLRRCKHCGYCSSDLPDFEELLDESDHRLFCKTLNNSNHTLHKLLPPQSTASQHYHLRRRTHDRQLPTQTSHPCNKNFVTRALYKDCYWIPTCLYCISRTILCSTFFVFYCSMSVLLIKNEWMNEWMNGFGYIVNLDSDSLGKSNAALT